ncbi:hypothetical protein AC578_6310 [Pseudocercospora eumusae]|uniref:Uncharacterized protein n=1 Tax=Pseudocercospora eumusae TaxID=321146 RepID=A0A139H220_9PEZI|nr:hypothetical protein AC578_6310 [Pseudocercospora eumusae]
MGMPAPRGSLTLAPCFAQHTSGLQRLSAMKASPSHNPAELVVLQMHFPRLLEHHAPPCVLKSPTSTQYANTKRLRGFLARPQEEGLAVCSVREPLYIIRNAPSVLVVDTFHAPSLYWLSDSTVHCRCLGVCHLWQGDAVLYLLRDDLNGRGPGVALGKNDAVSRLF